MNFINTKNVPIEYRDKQLVVYLKDKGGSNVKHPWDNVILQFREDYPRPTWTYLRF